MKAQAGVEGAPGRGIEKENSGCEDDGSSIKVLEPSFEHGR